MGQVHIDHVTLDDVVQSSELVVVATPAGTTEVSEPIDDQTHDGQAAPPFVWHRRDFTVEEVLLGDATRAGQTLKVDPADLDWDRELHRSYYVVGLSQSPLKQRYPTPEIADDAPRILFLGRDDGRLHFAIAGAEEHIDRREEVKELLATRASQGQSLQLVDGGARVRDVDLYRRVRKELNVFVVVMSLLTLTFAALTFVISPVWLHGGLAVCGAVATGVMIVARRRVVRRRHDATRWVRLGLVLAAPLAIAGEFYGGAHFLIGVVTMVERSFNFVRLGAAVGGFIGLAASFYYMLLLWKLARTDFGELLWESESDRQALEESLNYE